MPTSTCVVNHARVFVGADRSQLLAVKVLEHSLRRHTDMSVSVTSMHELDLPSPNDLRQSARTGFSFTRFAIPELAGFTGRALYLDADMLVFKDLREIYDLPFGRAKVIIQEELPEAAQAAKAGAPARRIKQCSVMMLDCGALDWKANEIIAGLDGRYTYEDLMFDLCLLQPEEIAYDIPFKWNSLEVYEPGRTGLIHYTDMNTQPWVYVGNPNGRLWLDEVRLMLDRRLLERDEIEAEIALGYFRPSLLAELDLGTNGKALSNVERDRLKRIDADAGFQPHREVMEQRKMRQALVSAYEKRLAGAGAVSVRPPAMAGGRGWKERFVSALRRRPGR